MLVENEDWGLLDWKLLENVKAGDTVLLTGAGFTCDFGGFLAQEMWSHIYNHPEVERYPDLLKLLRADFDYESVYYNVLRGTEYKEQDRQAFTNAISEAYELLDEEIRNMGKMSTKAEPVGISHLFHSLAANGRVGFIFTLNQDLFVERFFSTFLPWVGNSNLPTQDHVIDFKKDLIRLPDEAELKARQARQPLNKERLIYVKLHGSSNWQTSEGRQQMVIGLEKENDIAREPLLRSYAQIFRMVLRKTKKLLVIGYSFRDDHINKVIELAMAACHNPNLELFVICPELPGHFMERLCNTQLHGVRPPKSIEGGEFLVRKLSGYFPYTLADLFPSQSRDSLPWKINKKKGLLVKLVCPERNLI